MTRGIRNPTGLEGKVRIGMFIMTEETGIAWFRALGDDRSFDPQFSPERTRVFIEVDFDRNKIYAQGNPSCTSRRNCSDAKEFGGGFWDDFWDKTNQLDIEEGEDGKLTLKYELTDSLYSFGPLTPSITGQLTITPTGSGSVEVELDSDEYPSYEVYYDRDAVTETPLDTRGG